MLPAFLGGFPTTQGWNKGEPADLFPLEHRLLRGSFGCAFVQRSAAFSVAGGAGKTAPIPGIGSATLTGPLIQERPETIAYAPSLSQARTTFNNVKTFLGETLKDKRPWRVWDTSQHFLVEQRKPGQVLRCVGADPKRLHGPVPALLPVDEPTQFTPNTAEEASSVLQTSRGKIPGSRMIALGTRLLAGQSPFFNALLTVADDVQTQACTKGDPLFQGMYAAQS